MKAVDIIEERVVILSHRSLFKKRNKVRRKLIMKSLGLGATAVKSSLAVSLECLDAFA
jgi:hypothetical protein